MSKGLKTRLVLAVVSGALGRFMRLHGEATEGVVLTLPRYVPVDP